MTPEQIDAYIDELLATKREELRAALRAVLTGQKAKLCHLAKIGNSNSKERAAVLCIVAQMRPDEETMYNAIFGRYQQQQGLNLWQAVATRYNRVR